MTILTGVQYMFLFTLLSLVPATCILTVWIGIELFALADTILLKIICVIAMPFFAALAYLSLSAFCLLIVAFLQLLFIGEDKKK